MTGDTVLHIRLNEAEQHWLRKILVAAGDTEDGWLDLSAFGKLLTDDHPVRDAIDILVLDGLVERRRAEDGATWLNQWRITNEGIFRAGNILTFGNDGVIDDDRL